MNYKKIILLQLLTVKLVKVVLGLLTDVNDTTSIKFVLLKKMQSNVFKFYLNYFCKKSVYFILNNIIKYLSKH